MSGYQVPEPLPSTSIMASASQKGWRYVESLGIGRKPAPLTARYIVSDMPSAHMAGFDGVYVDSIGDVWFAAASTGTEGVLNRWVE